MIKLLVVDQQPIITKGLDSILKNSKDIKIECTTDNPENILNLIKNKSIDIILSEINFSSHNGITILKQLLKIDPSLKVLFYTSQAEEIYAVSAIKNGAKGFVSKLEDLTVLKKAIKEVYNNNIYLSSKISEMIQTKSNELNLNFKKLSNRETEVLKLLAMGKRNNEVSKLLDINEKTVSTYKMRVMKKLNAANLIDLVTQAKYLGL